MAAKKRRRTKKQQKKQRIIVAVLIVLIIALVIAAAGLAIRYIFPSAKGFFGNGKGFSDAVDANDPEKDQQIDMLSELRSSGDLFTVLKTWATADTGNSLMQSRDVTNVLLVGVDAGGTNSDAIMIASVNKKTGAISLASIMRDSYTFMETPYGETAAKINAAYANGGISCLVDTVENDYKIKIDHYFSVNFKTFAEVVDIIGGVSVPVQEYERRAMNGLAADDFPGDATAVLSESGDSVKLNGRQALLYCRIRKCDVDGDVSRTRRQRQFMSALIDGAKTLTAADLPSLAKTLHKYVSTDCSVTDLVSLGTQALTEKWYKYEIASYSFPQEENRMDYSGHAWVWIVDYPADAKTMQLKLYGATNIELSDDRRTAIDIVRNGGF